MTLQTDLENAVLTVQTDSQILHNIVHGDAQSTITVSSGEVKTMAKAISDIEVAGNQQIESLNINSVELQNAVTTATQEASNAQSYANQAVTLVNSAQQVLQSAPFRDIVFLTVANSPFDIDSSHNGIMFAVDTSGGDIIINLPLIADTDLPFNVTVKKKTNDSNAVFITPDLTDHIDENSDPYAVSSIGGASFIADTDTSPDTWITSPFGASAGEAKKQLFKKSDGDFATGDTTLTITNTPLPPSSSALRMTADGVVQHCEDFSYEPGTGVVTFDALGENINEIEFTWDSSGLPIGVPGDETVDYLKTATSLRGAFADIFAGLATKFATCRAVKDYTDQAGIIKQIIIAKNTAREVNSLSIPFDNTIPQQSEGKEYMTATITPKNATSELLVEVCLPAIDVSAAGIPFVVTMFRDNQANAIFTCLDVFYNQTYTQNMSFFFSVNAGSTAETTFKMRYGIGSGGTAYINRSTSGSYSTVFGNSLTATIKITEIAQ